MKNHWERISQKAPLCGISWLRSMVRIWSRVLMSGESPPWTHSTDSSMIWTQQTRHSSISLNNSISHGSHVYIEMIRKKAGVRIYMWFLKENFSPWCTYSLTCLEITYMEIVLNVVIILYNSFIDTHNNLQHLQLL